MELVIRINMDNAAFEDNPQAELRRILGELSQGQENILPGIKLRDVNGNVVGKIMIKD